MTRANAGNAKTQRVTPERTSDRPNETVQRILTAARAIVARDGYEAMTLRAINSEAGISNRGVASYYFGNKDGLTEAIVKEILKTYAQVTLPELPPEAPLEERIDSFIDAFSGYHNDAIPYLTFFSILPHMVRDDALRQHVEGDYGRYYEMVVEYFLPDADEQQRTAMLSIARIICALDDGFAVQRLIDGEAWDSQPAVEAMSVLKDYMMRVLEG